MCRMVTTLAIMVGGGTVNVKRITGILRVLEENNSPALSTSLDKLKFCVVVLSQER